MSKRIAPFTLFLLAVAALAAGIAMAAGGDGDEPLTGSTLARARAAALDHTGRGTVTATEVGDDGAAYGVEIRLADGTEVEVHLDADFEVIGRELDDDAGDREDDDDDDGADR